MRMKTVRMLDKDVHFLVFPRFRPWMRIFNGLFARADRRFEICAVTRTFYAQFVPLHHAPPEVNSSRNEVT